MSYDKELVVSRAFVAVFVGALAGATIVVLELVVPASLISAGAGGLDGAPWERIRNTVLLIGAFSFLTFLIGLFLVGVPAWLIAHRLGRRNWYDALILGGVLTFGVQLALTVGPIVLHPSNSSYSSVDGGVPTVTNNHITREGWVLFAKGAAQTAVAGAFVGLLIWKIAYRRVIPRQQI